MRLYNAPNVAVPVVADVVKQNCTRYPLVVVVDVGAGVVLGALYDLSREVKVLGRVRFT